MSEELKVKYRRNLEEAWNKGNLDALDESYAADQILHLPPFPDFEGLMALKQYVAAFRSTYSDFHIAVDEIIIAGDTIASRWHWQGKHTGQSALLPIPPTGKQVNVTGCAVSHLKGGKVVEEWLHADTLGLLQQLGVVPPLGQGGA